MTLCPEAVKKLSSLRSSPLASMILFGVIPAIIPVIPEVPIVPIDPLVTLEVGAVPVISPTRVLDLVDYSSSDSDPSEDSFPLAPELPLVSPFLCSDDSEVDSKSEPAEQRPERHESHAFHDVMVSRWWDRVTSRPSSPSRSSSYDIFAPSSEFPIAPVVAPPEIHRWPAILIRPKEAIPFGRPYHTHPNGSHFTLDSSSSGSSSDFLSDTSSGSPLDSLSDTSSVYSSRCDVSGQTHSGPSTRVASSRSLDSSSLSAEPSRKRCRSPTTSVPSSTLVLRLIAPTHADLLPPRKRFRDSYSPEDSREEHMEIGIDDAEAVIDFGIGDGAHMEDGIGMGVEIAASDFREDEEDFEAKASAGGTMEIVVDPLITSGISESTRGYIPDLEDTFYGIVHYMLKVPLDRITKFETAQRQLEAGHLMASRKRASLTDRIRRLGLENLKVQALLCIERD
ncbi:hypothetical protein Tco_0079928 [Tanacetum coccineum]